ncbi:hypothetical protein B0H10DRAFT_1812431 [Mycena sp. CBHHK59/15]|nr:hypothetical protein B0H10DRAFT_1812431 [Mycena sp. CBHHK59/15]
MSPAASALKDNVKAPVSPPDSASSSASEYSAAPYPYPLVLSLPPESPGLDRTRPSNNDRYHPYSPPGEKRERKAKAKTPRKMWPHALEKLCSTIRSCATTLGVSNRRPIYQASLEAHIDRLHAFVLNPDFYPVTVAELDQFKGLNTKTCKTMVAGLQHDVTMAHEKLLEMQRSVSDTYRLNYLFDC